MPYLALEAHGLAHRYPGASQPALHGLDLTLHKGEIFGLLGPNGAGKTTTISILSTILKPDAGSLTMNGIDPWRHRQAVRRIIGLVPQEIALYPSLTTRENLRFFGRLQNLRGRHLRRRIDATLAAVGLEQRADQPIATFSGGMKRRANLAVGLLHEPQVLFLDEPTVGIDPQSRQLILEQIEAFRDQGTTMLYTTHSMEEAQRICGRVAIMDQGRILAQDTVTRLLAGNPGAADLGELFLHLTGKALRDG
ncbi:ABC transporter ATP-binding protein [Desulfosarcina ovata subsp. sediminis]|uniref:ABC transporter ATP-binding protein n=1 Tax=Desulfosarcina ovata subsp. sediminis TaxID=885957 RepID=A0A5K7ZVP9_9BACT|nr:ABC transporter ATP-binding protein [Desulfosarcina ovata]BBO84317.1 ABC transporter ATP-binding protein [Desulfosarcina ovata subsp. sediminis]